MTARRNRVIFVIIVTIMLYISAIVYSTGPPTDAETIAANEGR